MILLKTGLLYWKSWFIELRHNNKLYYSLSHNVATLDVDHDISFCLLNASLHQAMSVHQLLCVAISIMMVSCDW